MMLMVLGFLALLLTFEAARWFENRERRRREAHRSFAGRPTSTRAGRVP